VEEALDEGALLLAEEPRRDVSQEPTRSRNLFVPKGVQAWRPMRGQTATAEEGEGGRRERGLDLPAEANPRGRRERPLCTGDRRARD
jgi:hypothetical protein